MFTLTRFDTLHAVRRNEVKGSRNLSMRIRGETVDVEEILNPLFFAYRMRDRYIDPHDGSTFRFATIC